MTLTKKELDRVVEFRNTVPNKGPETEMMCIDADTLEFAHDINGEQPTQAVKNEVRMLMQAVVPDMLERHSLWKFITPDVPETTIEANPDPMLSPLGTAAAQRLFTILIHTALSSINARLGLNLTGLNGVAWRPPHLTLDDASRHVPSNKRMYYQYQIDRHGDGMGAAAGDHFNLSAPWGPSHPFEVSDLMVVMAGRMRMITAPLMALSNATPIYNAASGLKNGPTMGTVMTMHDSARLARVWPGRSSVDVAEFMRGIHEFRKTILLLTEHNELRFGRDLYLHVRPQAKGDPDVENFMNMCRKFGFDIENNTADFQHVRQRFFASLDFGSQKTSFEKENFYFDEDLYTAIEAWRTEYRKLFAGLDRNRVELRFLETPPAFENQTPYEYLKSLQTFVELIWIYFTHHPDFLHGFSYNRFALAAIKDNEEQTLRYGLDAAVKWIPTNYKTTARNVLMYLLERTDDIAEALNVKEDLEIIRRILRTEADVVRPAGRLRKEAADFYNIKLGRSHDRALPNDDYPRFLLKRNRASMVTELAQIEADLARMPDGDKEKIHDLLSIVNALWNHVHVSQVSSG